jgi:hypothetical protein
MICEHDERKLIGEIQLLEESRINRFGVNLWILLAADAYLFAELIRKIRDPESYLEDAKVVFAHLLLVSVYGYFFGSLYFERSRHFERSLRLNHWVNGSVGLVSSLYLYAGAGALSCYLGQFSLAIFSLFGVAAGLIASFAITVFIRILIFIDVEGETSILILTHSVIDTLKKESKIRKFVTGTVVAFFGIALIGGIIETLEISELYYQLKGFKNWLLVLNAVAVFWVTYFIAQRLHHYRIMGWLEWLKFKVELGEVEPTVALFKIEGRFFGESVERYMSLKWLRLRERVNDAADKQADLQLRSISEKTKSSLARAGSLSRWITDYFQNENASEFVSTTQATRFLERERKRSKREVVNLKDLIFTKLGPEGISAFEEGFNQINFLNLVEEKVD